jgi:diguanylate cyclase (GGDEF)-like protein
MIVGKTMNILRSIRNKFTGILLGPKDWLKLNSWESLSKRVSSTLFGLKAKLIFLFSMLFILVISIVSFLSLAHQKRLLIQEVEKRARVMAVALAKSARDAVLAGDKLTLSSLIGAIQTDTDVVYSFIVDHRNFILMHSDVTKISTALPSARVMLDNSSSTRLVREPDVSYPILEISEPIRYGEKVIGTVYVGLGPADIEDLVQQARTRLFLTMGIGLFFGTVGILLLSNMFLRPVAALSKATEDLAAGNLDTWIPVKSRDELGNLGFSFNVMTKRLKTAHAELAEQAIRDPLTKLYNRRHFGNRIEEEIARADRSRHPVAILLCDLDNFKAINDTQGHQAGDEVLKAVSKSIQDSVRRTDLVFRWGGDEIVVILPDATRSGILFAADRIRKEVLKASKTLRVDVDISIGVALYPEHGANADELIRLADWALYIAKKSGGKIHIGEEEYRLDENSIKVVFQPIVDIRSDQLLGYEALSRDAHGKLRIRELLEKYNTIGQLYDLKNFCFKTQIKTAQEEKLKRVFINVDFNLLTQADLVHKPPGTEVIFEISEGEALHDIQNYMEIVRKWRERGFQFAIDDFGAGFISLSFLAQLRPNYIKLDRSTILQAVSSSKFRTVLKDLLVPLGHCSKHGIIAEGIETEKELQVVKTIGIYLVQGYLFGEPQELR